MNFKDLSELTVTVVGDLMLDVYSRGFIDRVAQEAPSASVMLVDPDNKVESLGGAANVAANIQATGAQANLVGVIGQDDNGGILWDLCNEKGIEPHFEQDPIRQTTTKLRYVDQTGTVSFRADFETKIPLNENVENSLLDSAIYGCSAMVLSDYSKGVLTPRLSKALIERASEIDIISLVDPKPENASNFYGADVVRPNLKEAREITGMENESWEEVGKALKEKMGCTYAVVTCAGDGMFCYSDKGFHTQQAIKKEVPNVSGAGDTTIAYLALSLAAGYNIQDAMKLASYAASVVVGKKETGTCSIDELTEVMAYEN